MPSITFWHRLEPLPQETKLRREPKQIPPDPLLGGLQARIRDPMWLLARQYDLGELTASNGGSPVSATIAFESAPVNGYRPSSSGPATSLPVGRPLEAHVEPEEVALGLRGAVQLGLRFETLLDGLRTTLGDAAVDQLTLDFRAAYPVDNTAVGDEPRDPAAAELRIAAAGRVVDGNKLYDAAKDAPNNVPARPSSAGQASAALTAFVAYRRGTYVEPEQSSPWVPDELHYTFSLSSGDLALHAPEFLGDAIEWHSFTHGADPLLSAPAPAAQADEWTFLPQNVTFRGMPNPRWWNFELGTTDFGELDTEHVDLAKLAVIDFALVYGNDWFELPLPLEIGSISRVRALVVTDTFGVRTLIRPTEQVAPQGEERWSMFKIASAEGMVGDFLFLPPSLGPVMDGPEVEDVLFVRDEMAAMGWGIERTIQGPLDTPLDGYEPYFQRLAELQAATPPSPEPAPDAPKIEYILGNSVPDNWIPLVPIGTSASDFVFRRGKMEITASALSARMPMAGSSSPGIRSTSTIRQFRGRAFASSATSAAHAGSMARRGPGWLGASIRAQDPVRGAGFRSRRAGGSAGPRTVVISSWSSSCWRKTTPAPRVTLQTTDFAGLVTRTEAWRGPRRSTVGAT